MIRPGEQQVTLHDGRSVSSYSEEWRAECEARAVLNMPTRMDRARYLGLVARRRGPAAADAIRELGLKIWRAQRETAAWNDSER